MEQVCIHSDFATHSSEPHSSCQAAPHRHARLANGVLLNGKAVWPHGELGHLRQHGLHQQHQLVAKPARVRNRNNEGRPTCSHPHCIALTDARNQTTAARVTCLATFSSVVGRYTLVSLSKLQPERTWGTPVEGDQEPSGGGEDAEAQASHLSVVGCLIAVIFQQHCEDPGQHRRLW